MIAVTLLAGRDSWFWHTPYPIRVLVLVVSAAWVALLAHELSHALMARLLGVRLWSIALGRGPVLWQGTIGTTHVRLALLPFHGEVRLLDRDAEDLGYGEAAAGGSHFEWREGRSWRAPLISVAGTLGNLLAAKGVLAFWGSGPRPTAPVLMWTMAIFLVNAFMLLNLIPLRGFDGWRIATHAAAWRRAAVTPGVPIQAMSPWPFAASLRVAALALLLAMASYLFKGGAAVAIVLAATIAEVVSAVAYAQARKQVVRPQPGGKVLSSR